MADWEHILRQVRDDVGLMKQWERYLRKYDYAAGYGWGDIVANVEKLIERMMVCQIVQNAEKYSIKEGY